MNMMVNIKGEAKLGPTRSHENIMIDYSEGVLGTDFIVIKDYFFLVALSYGEHYKTRRGLEQGRLPTVRNWPPEIPYRF